MYESKLRDRIKAANYLQRDLARDMGFSSTTLRNKLSGVYPFKKGELIALELLLAEKEKEMKKEV